MPRYAEVIGPLRNAYNSSAAKRDGRRKASWKIDERQAFLDRLRAAGSRTLLEVGAGTGQDSMFFRDSGLTVVATDLSAEMIAHCAAKALDARVAHVMELASWNEAFDAAYTINTLLHVPGADLPAALEAIAHVLKPEGLFFLGVYGGEAFEGIAPDDWHDPPRFFCFHTDDDIRMRAEKRFEIVDFHVVELDEDGDVAKGTAGPGVHFQSLTLRKP